MTPAALLHDLISISSVSSESNVPLIRYAQQFLSQAGWRWQELPYIDESGVAKLNLVAFPQDCPESQTDFDLALVCHTDTAPCDWADATRPIARDGSVYGRGACDVKGFLACALAAVASHPGANACLILTADEEIGCLGARRLVETLDGKALIRPRRAIIGEPTSLHPVYAGKGYCLAELTVRGREAHSAFPDVGESAIVKAAQVVLEVNQIAAALRAETDSAFDPPFTTVNIGLIQGGRAKNVVPGECKMLIEWRPIPDQDPEHVARLLDDLSDDLEVLRLQAGFATPMDDPLVQTLSDLAGRTPQTASFGTEAPWIRRLGATPVVFGPGDMRVAHSRAEHVPSDELDACRAILTRVLAEPSGTGGSR